MTPHRGDKCRRKKGGEIFTVIGTTPLRVYLQGKQPSLQLMPTREEFERNYSIIPNAELPKKTTPMEEQVGSQGLKSCRVCKKRPIDVKKWGLCSRCYGYYQSTGKLGEAKKIASLQYSASSIGFAREMRFARDFFNHKNWIYQPALFRFDEEKYSPNFFDGKEQTFIAVAGTRQAYHQNKEKYKKFRKFYESLKFEVRNVDGSLIEDADGNLVGVAKRSEEEP